MATRIHQAINFDSMQFIKIHILVKQESPFQNLPGMAYISHDYFLLYKANSSILGCFQDLEGAVIKFSPRVSTLAPIVIRSSHIWFHLPNMDSAAMGLT